MSEYEEKAPNAEELAAAEALRRSLEAQGSSEQGDVLGLLHLSRHRTAGELNEERKQALRRQLLDGLREAPPVGRQPRAERMDDYARGEGAQPSAEAANAKLVLLPTASAFPAGADTRRKVHQGKAGRRGEVGPRGEVGRRGGAMRWDGAVRWAIFGSALSCAAALALWLQSTPQGESASLKVAVSSPRVGTQPQGMAPVASRSLSARQVSSEAETQGEGQAADRPTADRLPALVRGEGAGALGSIAEAAEAYRSALDKQQPQAVQRAVVALEAAKTIEAKHAAYQSLAHLTPHVRNGKPGEPRGSIERAQSLYCQLAEAALQLGNPEQARSWSEQGIALGGPESPLLAQLWALKGSSLAQLGEQEAAAESYLSAIAIHESLLERRLKGRSP